VVFSVDDGQSRQVLETFPCPSGDVRTVELGCTRLEKGNTPAEYLLRRLRVKADHFFSFQPPKKPWFTWWRLAVAAQLIVVVSLVVVMVRQRRQ